MLVDSYFWCWILRRRPAGSIGRNGFLIPVSQVRILPGAHRLTAENADVQVHPRGFMSRRPCHRIPGNRFRTKPGSAQSRARAGSSPSVLSEVRLRAPLPGPDGHREVHVDVVELLESRHGAPTAGVGEHRDRQSEPRTPVRLGDTGAGPRGAVMGRGRVPAAEDFDLDELERVVHHVVRGVTAQSLGGAGIIGGGFPGGYRSALQPV